MPQNADTEPTRCPQHPERGVTHVVEYRMRDPFSPLPDEYLPADYALVCDVDGCAPSARDAARLAGADEATLDTYPATDALIAAITGLAVA